MQIIVYTGAILMLFLFVLMLVGVDASDSVVETIEGQRVMATVGRPAASALMLVLGVGQVSLGPVTASTRPTRDGNIPGLASCCSPVRLRLRGHQRLLITAAHRRDGARAPRAAHPEGRPRRDLAAQRMRDYAEHGKHPGPLPAPGVYARHNAVDTPALLPDGTAVGGLGLPRARRPRHRAVRAGAGRRHRRACSARLRRRGSDRATASPATPSDTATEEEDQA